MEGGSGTRPIKDAESLNQELIEARAKIRTLEQRIIDVADISRRLDVIESQLPVILSEKKVAVARADRLREHQREMYRAMANIVKAIKKVEEAGHGAPAVYAAGVCIESIRAIASGYSEEPNDG